ncbi:MAG: hydrogenase small subunit [Fibrobacter sp.]|nr:hydrogenase small subunit [Fibrobacter sp.]
MALDMEPSMESEKSGTSRRDFLKFCSVVATAIGLGPAGGFKVLAALTSANRPVVLWLHFAECTACTEVLLRATNPYIDDLLLDTVSVDYHETLMAGAGSTVHDILVETAAKNSGNFICVVEGAIPTKDNGVYGTINGKTMLSIAEEICPKARCIIAIGACASFGGIAAAAPNPAGAKNIIAALKHLNLPPVVTVPGCPPNPVSFVGVISYYLLNGRLPPTDQYLRPKFAYENTVHHTCPFVDSIDPVTGRCLMSVGCKGPNTYNNCTVVKYNNGTNFPMNAGHVCIGCSEPNFWDINTPFWGKHADDTDFPPLPVEIFEKEVSPIAVIPRQTGRNISKSSKKISGVFDLTGRKVSGDVSDILSHSRRSPHKLFIEKNGNQIKKHLKIK